MLFDNVTYFYDSLMCQSFAVVIKKTNYTKKLIESPETSILLIQPISLDCLLLLG